jgi:hypothetical protein
MIYGPFERWFRLYLDVDVEHSRVLTLKVGDVELGLGQESLTATTEAVNVIHAPVI